jgi:type II secretion system protein G
MQMTIRTRTRNAFTLIEILIVVVILGILAAVVIPQFTNAADDANNAGVRTQLQTLRSQVELYRAENGGATPALATTGWADLINGGYLPGPPKNPMNGESAFGSTAADGWRYSAFQIDPANNQWVAGGTNFILVANKLDGSIYHDFAASP